MTRVSSALGQPALQRDHIGGVRRVPTLLAAGALAAFLAWHPPLGAQRGGMFLGSAEDPAIAYSTAPVENSVAELNARLEGGTATLNFSGRGGYLGSALEALGIPVESQVLVFSPTSFQAKRINPSNPRALFFNDRVALGWVRDGEIIEVAVQDARQGMVFYTLDQRPTERPVFRRTYSCLACHMAGDTLGVAGMLMFSTTSDATGSSKSVMVDHRTPVTDRFGGWLVTGSGGLRHRGNAVPALDGRRGGDLASVSGLFDPDGYRSNSSDVAALLVLSHQVHMTNLITRIGWEARAADPMLHAPFVVASGEGERIAQMMSGIAAEVVDYLLFVDEAPLSTPVSSRSGFAERFAASGPRDSQGRSLHDLDLKTRLLRYRCSYLIYSAAFEALPPSAKDAMYRRLWEVLSGVERGVRYRTALPLADRQAVVEILRETKPGLPAYFRGTLRP